MNQKTKNIFDERSNRIIKNSQNDFKRINVLLSLENAFSLSTTFAREQ